MRGICILRIAFIQNLAHSLDLGEIGQVKGSETIYTDTLVLF